MGKAAAVKATATKQESSGTSCRKVFKSVASGLFWVHLYWAAATLCNFRSMWSWTLEPLGFQCNHPPYPVNNTGMKVLVYSLPKTGTTTMNKYLLKLMRSYHSEDFLMHIWAPFADEYWQKPENGGVMFPSYRLATPGEPAYKGHSFYHRKEWAADLQVLNGMPRERLAEMIGRCRLEAAVFDGLEDLFWPVYELSPDVKVISLSWRTFEENMNSKQHFGPMMVLALLALNHLNTGQHFLPWNSFVIPFLDYLTGRHVTKFWREGTPLNHDNQDPFYDPLLLLHRQSMTERRICQHWGSGFIGGPTTDPESYKEWWDKARRIVPKDRLFDWDYRKHTMADLCKFLEIKDNPACKLGKLKNIGQPIMTHEREHWLDMLLLVPYFITIHIMNYKIFYFVLGRLARMLLFFIPSELFPKKMQKKIGKSKAA